MKTKELLFTKRDDIATLYYPEWGIETGALQGSWKNVNSLTGQISRLIVRIENGKLFLNCFGKLETGELDWGSVEGELFCSKVNSNEIEGFGCNYDFGFMETRIAGNVKYGVMVIQAYNTFKDESDRNNYISREFFVFDK